MGGFYGSIHARTEDRDRVLQGAERVARSRNLAILAGPAKNGWVGLYPELSGQDDTVGAEIARELGGEVLHLMVHDDDIFAYWLYRNGNLVDSYHSRPGYFGEEFRAEEQQRAGQPEAFRPILGDGVRKLAPLLDREAAPLFASMQLQSFAKLLKIPNALTSYEYLQQGEWTGIVGWRKFEELPKAKPPDAAADERRQRMSEGLLLATESREGDDLRTARCGDGFLAAWQTQASQGFRVTFDWRRPAAFGPKAPPLSEANLILGLAADASGQRIAVALRDRIEVRGTGSDDLPIVSTITVGEVVTGLALSPDGRFVAHSSETGEAITTVEEGRRIATLPRVNRKAFVRHDDQSLAFHPSGEWLAVGGTALGLISLAGEPRRRTLCPGGRHHYEQQIVASLTDADLDELERQQRQQLTAQLEQFRQLASPEATAKRLKGRGLSAKQFEAMKPALEQAAASFSLESLEAMLTKRFEEMREQQRKARAGELPQAPAIAKEPPEVVGFSRDGRWLWCGGRQGLRVYRWDQVVAAAIPADEAIDTPPPWWSSSRPVAAVAEERSGAALLFGGPTSELHRIDLETGAIREVARLPGPCHVTGLHFSAGGEALLTATAADPLKTGIRSPSRIPSTLDVWDYERLIATK